MISDRVKPTAIIHFLWIFLLCCPAGLLANEPGQQMYLLFHLRQQNNEAIVTAWQNNGEWPAPHQVHSLYFEYRTRSGRMNRIVSRIDSPRYEQFWQGLLSNVIPDSNAAPYPSSLVADIQRQTGSLNTDIDSSRFQRQHWLDFLQYLQGLDTETRLTLADGSILHLIPLSEDLLNFYSPDTSGARTNIERDSPDSWSNIFRRLPRANIKIIGPDTLLIEGKRINRIDFLLNNASGIEAIRWQVVSPELELNYSDIIDSHNGQAFSGQMIHFAIDLPPLPRTPPDGFGEVQVVFDVNPALMLFQPEPLTLAYQVIPEYWSWRRQANSIIIAALITLIIGACFLMINWFRRKRVEERLRQNSPAPEPAREKPKDSVIKPAIPLNATESTPPGKSPREQLVEILQRHPGAGTEEPADTPMVEVLEEDAPMVSGETVVEAESSGFELLEIDSDDNNSPDANFTHEEIPGDETELDFFDAPGVGYQNGKSAAHDSNGHLPAPVAGEDAAELPERQSPQAAQANPELQAAIRDAVSALTAIEKQKWLALAEVQELGLNADNLARFLISTPKDEPIHLFEHRPQQEDTSHIDADIIGQIRAANPDPLTEVQQYQNQIILPFQESMPEVREDFAKFYKMKRVLNLIDNNEILRNTFESAGIRDLFVVANYESASGIAEHIDPALKALIDLTAGATDNTPDFIQEMEWHLSKAGEMFKSHVQFAAWQARWQELNPTNYFGTSQDRSTLLNILQVPDIEAVTREMVAEKILLPKYGALYQNVMINKFYNQLKLMIETDSRVISEMALVQGYIDRLANCLQATALACGIHFEEIFPGQRYHSDRQILLSQSKLLSRNKSLRQKLLTSTNSWHSKQIIWVDVIGYATMNTEGSLTVMPSKILVYNREMLSSI